MAGGCPLSRFYFTPVTRTEVLGKYAEMEGYHDSGEGSGVFDSCATVTENLIRQTMIRAPVVDRYRLIGDGSRLRQGLTAPA